MIARAHNAGPALALSLGILAASACRRETGGGPKQREGRAPSVAPVAHGATTGSRSEFAPASLHPPRPTAPATGAEVAIAAGVLRLGSATGSADRNPAREADEVAVDVPAFAIDALPYPNDPDLPAKTHVSRAEAAALCAEQGKRLCTEIEWERACKGREGSEYPDIGAFDAARCASTLASCASSFGVFGLGTTAREWTSSDATGGLGDSLRTAVVRGASKDASEPRQHRCASRDAATPDSRSESLSFRCCRGAAPTLDYPVEPEFPPFAEATISEAELRAVLAAMPETHDVAESFRLFSSDERTKALQKAGHSRAGMAPWVLAERPLSWSPMRGERLLIAAGDTPRGALLVAYHPIGPGRGLFAGRLLTRDEHTAVLVAYKPDSPGEVLFSTCWGCGGEGGAVVLGADSRVQIVQR